MRGSAPGVRQHRACPTKPCLTLVKGGEDFFPLLIEGLDAIDGADDTHSPLLTEEGLDALKAQTGWLGWHRINVLELKVVPWMPAPFAETTLAFKHCVAGSGVSGQAQADE